MHYVSTVHACTVSDKFPVLIFVEQYACASAFMPNCCLLTLKQPTVRAWYRVLKSNGVYLGISYGSAASRMHCFLSPDFHWDPVMYTMDRTEAQVGSNGLFQDDRELTISGPHQPQVSHDFAKNACTNALHACMHLPTARNMLILLAAVCEMLLHWMLLFISQI